MILNKKDIVYSDLGDCKRALIVLDFSNNGSILGRDKKGRIIWTHEKNVIKIKRK